MKQIIFSIIVLLISTSAFSQIVDAKRDTETGKYGFVDANGNWIVKPIYERAYWNKNGGIGSVSLHKYNEHNRMGAINDKGKVITEYKYNAILPNGKSQPIIVSQHIDGKEKYGAINQNGKELVPCEYDGGYTYNETDFTGAKVIAIETKINNRKYTGYFDWNGRILIPNKYIKIVNLKNEAEQNKYTRYVTDGNHKYGLYNTDFKELLACEYDSITFDWPTAKIQKGDKWGAYSITNEKLIVPIAYDSLSNTGLDGLVAFKRDGKYGYVSEEGEIIPPIYDAIAPFKNDVAKVTIDGKVTLLKNPLKDGVGIMIAGNSAKKADKKKLGEPAVSRYPAPSSEVDSDIPVTKHRNDNRFAFIIANENYDGAPVPYALNDGRMFREYCTKALGVPEKHVRMYEDATFGNIIAAVEQVKEISAAYEGDVELIFYYAGHGVPDEKRNSAYLLPIDGNVSDIATTGYSLERLYGELANLNARNVTVFLDACFSGAKREDEMLLSGRGVAIKVKEEAPKGNMVVFSASTGDETAHQLADKTHGLFTYFLLKGIKDANGKVTLGALSDYVTKQVKRQSVVINNKRQTPTVIPSPSVTDTWRDLTL